MLCPSPPLSSSILRTEQNVVGLSVGQTLSGLTMSRLFYNAFEYIFAIKFLGTTSSLEAFDYPKDCVCCVVCVSVLLLEI